jgi:hypothetical protein
LIIQVDPDTLGYEEYLYPGRYMEVIMENIIINFENLPWENPSPGIRYKSYINGNQKMRLLEFSNNFEEKEWCFKGHAGMVMEGECSLYFKTTTIRLKTGNTFFIPAGEEYGHKVILKKGDFITLLLFELI